MILVSDIADAVVRRLRAGSFSRPITPQKRHQPTFELIDLAELKISVVPKSAGVTAATRKASYFDCAVDVGVQQKIAAEDGAALDDLMRFVEELVLWLRFGELDGSASDARFLNIRNEPIYDPKHLQELRVFTSVITVTYRVMR